MKKHEFKINNIPIEINSYLDESHLSQNDLIDSILKQTKPNKRIGYGGFIKREYFKKFLEHRIKFDDEMKNTPLNLSDKEHVSSVKDALKKCSSVLEDKLYIFTFPKYSKFISEKMNGASGVNTFENVFYIMLSPYSNKSKQKISIKNTVAHELGHALSKEHRNYDDIFRMLKEEGLNEHFRENMIGGGRDPWTKAISKKKSMEIFKEVKEKIKSGKSISYMELFHGAGKYPRWSGYTIGYYLMKNYLKDLKNINWKELFKTPSKEIMSSILKN